MSGHGIACILLAAGTGTRFQGEKLLYEVNGIPMGVRAIRLHAALPYARRILVTQRRHSRLADCAAENGFEVYYNDAPERGIASSIGIALSALAQTDGLSGILFGVCDQPYLARDTVVSLMDRFAEMPDRIVAPSADGRRGNPVIFPVRFLSELATLHGDTGGSAVIRTHPEALTLVPLADSRELDDIDKKPE